MKDTVRQNVNQGDVVVYIQPYYSSFRMGILLKVTPKGNATIAHGTGKYNKDSGRKYFIKIDSNNLELHEQEKLNKIKEYYGYTGNRTNS